MYTIYKKVNDTESVLAYCDNPMECAQAIRVDAEISDVPDDGK